MLLTSPADASSLLQVLNTLLAFLLVFRQEVALMGAPANRAELHVRLRDGIEILLFVADNIIAQLHTGESPRLHLGQLFVQFVVIARNHASWLEKFNTASFSGAGISAARDCGTIARPAAAAALPVRKARRLTCIVELQGERETTVRWDIIASRAKE